ncbi:MAG: hypothetical protein R3F59_19685 [Myxococcota bacterium]
MKSLPQIPALALGVLVSGVAAAGVIATDARTVCLGAAGPYLAEPGKGCEDETLGRTVGTNFVTPHAEALGDHPWAYVLRFDDGSGQGAIRQIDGTSLFEVRVTGLTEVDEAQFAVVDLDDDGITDALFYDSAGHLDVYYDFDLGGQPVLTAPDATIAVDDPVVMDAWEDLGVDVLQVCMGDGSCPKLSQVVRGEEPGSL